MEMSLSLARVIRSMFARIYFDFNLITYDDEEDDIVSSSAVSSEFRRQDWRDRSGDRVLSSRLESINLE